MVEAPKRPEDVLAGLRTARSCLERDRESLVRCCSQLREEDGEYVVIPGTLDDDAVEDVADYDRAIAALRITIEGMEFKS